MTPTIHCVRHGQAFHNLSIANHNIHDPLLTDLGEEQSRRLLSNSPALQTADLIVSSPLKRTLCTSLLAFDSLLAAKETRIIALPELQETSDLPCDTGSQLSDLATEFAHQTVDFSLIKPDWDSKKGKWAPSASAIEKRAQEARTWLLQRPEREIVVVTHGGFLQYLTSNWTSTNCTEIVRAVGWANAECRSYVFSSADPGTACLVETVESRERRMGRERGLDHNEKTQLKRTATEEGLKT